MAESKCKSCGAPLFWVKMRSGKPMPLNPTPIRVVIVNNDAVGEVRDGYVSHFSTCPDAAKHRKPHG